MWQYNDLLEDILTCGFVREDRTGTGTRALFSQSMTFDLNKGFPLHTGKRLHWKSIVHELLWLLRGETNTRYLTENGVSIWDEWANEDGDLGRVYGAQWREFRGVGDIDAIARFGATTVHVAADQIRSVQTSLRLRPFSRRHVVSAWNPVEVDDMALPPCHCLFQFMVDDQRRLHCQMYQRSADMFLGVPFNIASYSLLTMMMARVCGFELGEFTHVIGDAHIYHNHVEQVRELLGREERPLPEVQINIEGEPLEKDIWDIEFADIILEGYHPHPSIKAPVAV